MNSAEILEAVIRSLAKSVRALEEDITPASRLYGALGLDSMGAMTLTSDMLVQCRVTIESSDLYPVDFLTRDPAYILNDHITPTGIQALRQEMPWLDIASLEENPKVTRLHDLVTVRAIAQCVEFKLKTA